MIETSLTAWLSLMAMILLASAAGYSISRLLPWSDRARGAGMPFAVGLVLAPFLAGFVSILVLLLLPRGGHAVHLVASMVALAAGAVISPLLLRSKPMAHNEPAGNVLGVCLLKWGLLVWGGGLLVNAIFLPLIANDALEYATVGRELFFQPNLSTYPLLNPEANSSGFFGPWTHPPLYVSLIYLASILQGHADAPGLMRLIAPWFVLSSTMLMVALGRLYSPGVGWLSGLLFISTPLLFQGAVWALIDSLPVSAMVLLIAAMVGVRQASPGYPVVLGLVLGIGLWTHSQAVLLIPLFLAALCVQEGIQHWKKLIGAIFVSLVVAVIVGGAWYVRNYLLFGSPISDNPQVYALPELDWRSYFVVARGLEHGWAVLQYGVFKGWFSFEAFGGVFWLFAAGAALFLRQQGAKGVFQVLRSGAGWDWGGNGILWLGLVLPITYFIGVAVSAALGIDLMIRNDRYMLIIVPPVVFLGAYFLNFLFSTGWALIHDPTVGAAGKDAMLAGYWVAGLIVAFHTALVAWNSLWRDVPARKGLMVGVGQEPDADVEKRDHRSNRILDYWPSLQIHRELHQHVPEESLVLALRPADMYYANRKMVSYLDPRLLPFYLEKSPYKAAEMLKGMGIHYVVSPDYSLPPVYNSGLMAILADPQLSRLVTYNGGSQLYELVRGEEAPGKAIDLTPGNSPWVKSWQTRYGLSSVLSLTGFKPQLFDGGESESTLALFHRDFSVLLSTGKARHLIWGGQANAIAVESAEYVIRMKVSGEGYCTLWLAEFDEYGSTVVRPSVDRDRPIRIGDFPLTRDKPHLDYSRRVKFDANTRFIRIGLEHRGKSKVVIEKVALERLTSP